MGRGPRKLPDSLDVYVNENVPLCLIFSTVGPLWPELHFVQRSWLSANNIVFNQGRTAVVDTGYCTEAQATVQGVRQALQGQTLAHIVNTHLHSDHCGGNAALPAAWPRCKPGLHRGDWPWCRSGARWA